jgi:GTP-binding protein LepA
VEETTAMTSQNQIRNIALIAHINHGKSTLADRLLERTGTIPPLKMREQFLDNMELERERGVTIKLKTVRMKFSLPTSHITPPTPHITLLNLIDTPGHVDFSYEVSRSLAACEGALLIVDAVAGIQAQTVAHTQKALDLGLKIIPVVNKIDLVGAEPEKVAADLVRVFGFSREDILFASAKKGEGIEEILQAIVERVPPPKGDPTKPLRALVFDSSYDEHKGAVAFVKIVDGSIILHSSLFIHSLASGAECEPVEVGHFVPEMKPSKGLSTGEVGYVATGLKDISLVRVGDTLTTPTSPTTPLPGYQEPQPVVFVSFYPLDNKDFSELEAALKKLRLTDPAVSFERESGSLGQGFRCGFLGVFHSEIVKERLERDYDLEIFATAPSVEYLTMEQLSNLTIKRASDLPQISMEALEPWVRADIFSPKDFLGPVMQLCQDKRGVYVATDYVSESQVKLIYELPLAELIVDFYDRLKSLSSGFASLDYELIERRPVEVSRLDILVAGERIEPLAQIVLKKEAERVGQQVVKRLKEVIPKQQFAVALQAAVGGKILARETIPALRKDVTAKLYGGDVTRKRKLLEKQKKGKKRLKQFGRVSLPPEAFFAVK